MPEPLVRLDTQIAVSTDRTLSLLMAVTGELKTKTVNDALALGLLNLGLIAELPDPPVLRNVGRPKKNQEDLSMEITLPPYPVSAGRATANQLRRTAERAVQERDALTAALDDALAAFEAAFERVDSRASVDAVGRGLTHRVMMPLWTRYSLSSRAHLSASSYRS